MKVVISTSICMTGLVFAVVGYNRTSCKKMEITGNKVYNTYIPDSSYVPSCY